MCTTQSCADLKCGPLAHHNHKAPPSVPPKRTRPGWTPVAATSCTRLPPGPRPKDVPQPAYLHTYLTLPLPQSKSTVPCCGVLRCAVRYIPSSSNLPLPYPTTLTDEQTSRRTYRDDSPQQPANALLQHCYRPLFTSSTTPIAFRRGLTVVYKRSASALPAYLVASKVAIAAARFRATTTCLE